MAEEDVAVAAAATVPTPEVAPSAVDHKRKLEDLECEERNPTLDLNADTEPEAVENAKDVEGDDGASDAKRPRLEDKPDGLASENGFTARIEDVADKEDAEKEPEDNMEMEGAKDSSEEVPVMGNNEEAAQLENGDNQPAEGDGNEETAKVENSEQPGTDAESLAVKNPPQSTSTDVMIGEQKQPSAEIPQEDNLQSEGANDQEQTTSDGQTTKRKMDVPNNKVGVLIGKAGDTIRYLQINSGAKIQITRDAEADPYATSRQVELIGTLESINKAEKLIKDVIAEADAGGSPSLVARGFATAPTAGGGEQIQIQVPNEKVGLIIGKGGETIKSLQTRSGARIQLIPQHLPEGDQSKERTVRVTGDKKQIETAREMIKEVMSQPVKASSFSGGYNQNYRPRGPNAAHWGARGPPGHPSGYDYQNRGPSHSQYPPSYGGYPQQVPPRGGYGSGWEQRPPTTMQGPPPSGGYDYYGGPGGGHLHDPHSSAPHSNSFHGHVQGRSPAPGGGAPSSQAYNYGQLQGAEYGQPTPYSQAPPQQSYGHGYEEAKYGNQGPTQHPYGVHVNSHPGYPQNAAQPGYASHQQYGRPQAYVMPSQAPAAQSYGPPRPSQPGDAAYQGPYSANQPYAQNVPPQQQSYSYASSGAMQQTYPPYGSAPATDGYNQQPPASGYAQQGVQPVSGYAQPGGQPGYPQGSQAGYGSYPTTQAGYVEQQAGQAAPNAAGYGYQGNTDPNYNSGSNTAVYGAPQSGQQGYAQPGPTPQAYDQAAVAPAGAYAGAPGSAPVAYGKSVSPKAGYPQYDSTQVYGAHA